MTEVIISEHGYIGCDGGNNEGKFTSRRNLDPKIFKELKEYWESSEETFKLFDFVNKNCLKAKNYVGVIQTKNLILEILPKIYKNEDDEIALRKNFIEMLKVVLNINETQIKKADLSTFKNRNIYEIFISLFIESMDKLIHKGIRSNYITKEENQPFLKGKLKINEHIKKNYLHKERFFVEFDEYLQDRAENRLLKSTIALLLKKTKDNQNKKALRQQFFIFDEVKLSNNYKRDFKKINIHRGMEHYRTPLRFAEVFLLNESFSSMRGNDNVFALVFPMEKLFENYIEVVLNNSKDYLGIEEVMVNGGKNEYFLSNNKCKMARLQPDYLLKMKNGEKIVTDAKWKILEIVENEDEKCDNVIISSNDVYQVFAYLNFYKCKNTAYLFVPKVKREQKIELHYEKSDYNLTIIPLDLDKVIKNKHLLKEPELWHTNTTMTKS